MTRMFVNVFEKPIANAVKFTMYEEDLRDLLLTLSSTVGKIIALGEVILDIEYDFDFGTLKEDIDDMLADTDQRLKTVILIVLFCAYKILEIGDCEEKKEDVLTYFKEKVAPYIDVADCSDTAVQEDEVEKFTDVVSNALKTGRMPKHYVRTDAKIDYEEAVAIHQQHIAKIAPVETTLLKKYMRKCEKRIGEFSKSSRFQQEATAAKTLPCRAVYLLKSALSDDQLSRIQQAMDKDMNCLNRSATALDDSSFEVPPSLDTSRLGDSSIVVDEVDTTSVDKGDTTVADKDGMADNDGINDADKDDTADKDGTTAADKNGMATSVDKDGTTAADKDGMATSVDKDGTTAADKDGTTTSVDKDGTTASDKDGMTTADKDGTTDADKDDKADKDGATTTDKDGTATSVDKDGTTAADKDGTADNDGTTSADKDGTTNADKDGKADKDGTATSVDKDGTTAADKKGTTRVRKESAATNGTSEESFPSAKRIKITGLDESINAIITPKEIEDLPLSCEAPNCSKPVTSTLLTCGVCNKQIHVLCDPKARTMKKTTLRKINFYCSFH